MLAGDTPILGPEVETGAFPVQPGGGEKMLFRAGPIPCLITIKVSPANSPSSPLTVGTWEFPVDYVIPMHKHAREHEILFFTRGSFSATVDGAEIAAVPGTTLNLPPGAWHEVRNTGGEPGEMIWFVTPAGVEGFFRETSQPPGIPWSQLSPAVIAAAAARYGLTLRPDSETETSQRAPGSPLPVPSEDSRVEELVPRALSILAEETERWRAGQVDGLLARKRGTDRGAVSRVDVHPKMSRQEHGSNRFEPPAGGVADPRRTEVQ